MVAECLCLKGTYKKFLNFVTEMEISLMFPSMLKDLSLSPCQVHNLNLFNTNIKDCSDLFQEVLAVKEEFSVGLKRNWYGKKDHQNSKRDITSKFRSSLELLVKVTHLVKLVKKKYIDILNNTMPDQYISASSHCLPHIDHRGVKNLSFNVIADKFLEEMKELDSIILIPSLLIDVNDTEINNYIRQYNIPMQNTTLSDILEFLRNVRNDLIEVPNKNAQRDSHLLDFHSNLSELLRICSSLMQTYQNELHEKTGTEVDQWYNSHKYLYEEKNTILRRELLDHQLEFSY